MSVLLVFRTYADVDHVVPVAWKLLERGEEVHGLVSTGYDPRSDYRLRFLERYDNFHLHEVWPRRGGRLRRVLVAPVGWARNLLPWSFWFLLRHRVRLAAVEWGHGVVDAYEPRLSLRAAARLVKDLLVSVRDAGREPLILRSNLIVAAWFLRRRLVCLPHGLNVKLDAITTEAAALALEHGPYPWTDQNRFDAYVLNTEHHRQWHIDHASGDPAVMQTWGSARWSPEWVEVNRRIAPPFEWPEPAVDRVKVVLMVPKWKKRVRAEAVVDLVKRLQDLDCVSLAIKGHPRPEDGSADPLRADSDLDWQRIHDVTGVDSISLIRACDVVIDAGSSIGIEAVMQGKVLVNPSYVHEIRTLFDEIEGAAVVAESSSEVIAYLRRHASGSPHEVSSEGRAELMRRAVYASRPERFDVPQHYADRIVALAGGHLESHAREARTVPDTAVRR